MSGTRAAGASPGGGPGAGSGVGLAVGFGVCVGLGSGLEPLELAVEVSLADAEDLGRLVTVALALLEHALHVAALHLRQRHQRAVIVAGAERGLEPDAER